MNSITSPSRRVLGDKDPNAIVHALSPGKTKTSIDVTSPSRVRLSTPERTAPLVSPRAGQKRKIEQVNEEDMAESQSANTTHPLSQVTSLLSDSPSVEDMTSTTTLDRAKAINNSTFASFHASQDDVPHIQDEFEIHDEPSQQTLDNMHAVTLTQHTSQLIPPLRPNLVKEASQISLSMSSLIDFESDPSSQSDDMQPIQEVEVTELQRPQTEEVARKEMLHEKAEALRTRLQLAFYKIQTNQVTKPFSHLQPPTPRSSSPNLPDLLSSPRSSSTIRGDQVSRIVLTPESKVAIARARATMDPKPVARPLSALPMPKIVPTAFSARWNHGHSSLPVIGSSQEELASIPSSPPLSPEADDAGQDKAATRSRVPEPKTPMRWMSPAGSQQADEDDRPKGLQRSSLRPGSLTSSVVKGQAANCLLDLVRGARSGGVGMCGV